MQSFEFFRADDASAAIAASARSSTAQQGASVRFVAGGTTLLDLMKLNVEQPAYVVDINRLALDKVESLGDGGLKIGATVRNELAEFDRPVAFGAEIVAPSQRPQRITMQDVLDGEADRAMHLMGDAATFFGRLGATDFCGDRFEEHFVIE